MNGNAMVPVGRESWVNPALLRWQWRRHRWLNLFALVLSAGILAGLFLNELNELSWSGNIVTLGVMVAGISGVTAAGDTAGAFLLARPVSRRQVFNTLVIGNLLPWFLLTVVPTVFAIAVSPGRSGPQDRFLMHPAVFYLVFVLWSLIFYLASVYQGCYFKIYRGRYYQTYHPDDYRSGPGNEVRPQPSHSISIVWLLVMGLSFAGDRVWAGHRIITILSSYGSALAVTGVVLTVWSYQAGWRLFRELDL